MKQAIVFDVEDVLVNNRPEFFIATYNVYKNNSGNNLITMIEDVPSDFIEKYSVPDRWANQIKHRLACYHCRDNAITPKTREEFEEIMGRFSEAEIKKLEESVARVRTELKKKENWYFDIVKPFDGIQKLVAEISKKYDLFVSTSNPQAKMAVMKYFPEFPEKNIYTKEHGTKPENVKLVIKQNYDSVYFIDDNFTNTIDVVDAVPDVRGLVNDWGGKFSRKDLENEPSLQNYKDKIKIVNMLELSELLL